MHRCGRIRFEFRRVVTKPGTREGTGYVPEDSQPGRNRSVFRLSGCPAPGLGQKYISPSTGCFLASLASGDKAVAAAPQSKFAPGTLQGHRRGQTLPRGNARTDRSTRGRRYCRVESAGENVESAGEN